MRFASSLSGLMSTVLLFSIILAFAHASPHSRHAKHVRFHSGVQHHKQTSVQAASVEVFPIDDVSGHGFANVPLQNDNLLIATTEREQDDHQAVQQTHGSLHSSFIRRGTILKSADSLVATLEARSAAVNAVDFITVITVVLTETISPDQACVTPSSTRGHFDCQNLSQCTFTSYVYSCIVESTSSLLSSVSSIITTSALDVFTGVIKSSPATSIALVPSSVSTTTAVVSTSTPSSATLISPSSPSSVVAVEPSSTSSEIIAASPSSTTKTMRISSAPVVSASTTTSSAGLTSAPASSVVPFASVKVPSANALLLGASNNVPSTQYIKRDSVPIITLNANEYVPTIDTGLITNYVNMWSGSGYLELNSTDSTSLSTLATVPRLSRDGGKGGKLNGHKLFIFCDTESFDGDGNFVGFVSNSVSLDNGNQGTLEKSLVLQDPVGEWDANNGRSRYFIPLTEGEAAYNAVMAGKGQRYAIWPDSSIIQLDATSGIIYAPILFTNADTSPATFTQIGVTLVTLTTPTSAGPLAERTVPLLFSANPLQWGTIGGIRSWGTSGVGGDDGYVYIFAAGSQGLLMGRVTPAQIASAVAYEYWHGNSTGWSTNDPGDSSAAYIANGAFSTIDIFYSPFHQTFIMVYMNIYIDNTFYWRYLEATTPIVPQYAEGIDMVAFLTHYQWSTQYTLYEQQKGSNGYNYAGGVHFGYYDDDDITVGGTKMLLSWTAPSTVDPSTGHGGYDIVHAQVVWQ